MQGQHVTPRKVRELFLSLAESIPQDADIIGSADTTNPYEVLTQFVVNGDLIVVTIRKGGAQ